MATLYDVLTDAQQGKVLDQIGREFGLTQQQTQAAVAALLPAISMGLKRSTTTPEGLGELLGLMGRQPDLYAMYEDPHAAFSREGRAAGNAALANMFGSPDASRAIADQAQQLSGVTSGILKKLLPILAGILISGLMRSGSGQASPSAPPASPGQGGGGLFDILRQVFQQGTSAGSGSAGPTGSPVPPIGDILDSMRGGRPSPTPEKSAAPANQPIPVPTDGGGQATPGGDLLSQILRDLEKAIRDGRLKPVVVGPYEIDVPGRAGAPGTGSQPQPPDGDILGQILREVLGGAQQSRQATLAGGVGSAVFGDRLEAGRDVDQTNLDSLQEIFDRFLGAPPR
jgi:hypothetical protein